MKIGFRTNLDNYQKYKLFPDGLTQVPRVGDKIRINDDFISDYRDKRLPTCLVVVDVTWTQHSVICELWYSKTDVEMCKQLGVNLF